MVTINTYNLIKNGRDKILLEDLNIKKTNNELYNIINEQNRVCEGERTKFIQNILRDIEKKDRIIGVYYVDDKFYVSNMLFNVVDGVDNSALVHDYVIKIEEYRLLGELKCDLFFKEELEDVVEYYQRFSEETLSNVSDKLSKAAEKIYIRRLEEEILLSINRYCKTANIDDIVTKEQATKYFSHAINSESFLKQVKEFGDYPSLYKKVTATLFFGPQVLSIAFLSYLGYKYGLNYNGDKCYIAIPLFMSGIFSAILDYKLLIKGRLVNFKSYLQELQNKFHLSAEAMKKSDFSEKNEELLNNVQRISLEDKFQFSNIEKLFNIVDKETEPVEVNEKYTESVYDYNPSLRFGYKEQ